MGLLLAARRMWSDLGLDTTLDQLARPDRRETVRLSDRALVLVANRLTAPASEHALARWLESDFVCDRCGRRFMAAWRDDAERLRVIYDLVDHPCFLRRPLTKTNDIGS